MECLHPVNLRLGQRVPCGRCAACRSNRVFTWVMRLTHELEYYSGVASFLTLTYDESHYPVDGNLSVRDMQLFFKRLRLDLAPLKVRYYYAGEYGPSTMRPHYHAIVFGLDPDCVELVRDAWGQGFVKVGTVTPASLRYVVGYIMDKGDVTFSDFDRPRVPPFQRQSQGIGRRWLEDHRDDVSRDLTLRYKGKPVGLPRYYVTLLGDAVTDERRNDQSRERAATRDERLARIHVGYFDRADYERAYRAQLSEQFKHFTDLRKMSKSL